MHSCPRALFASYMQTPWIGGFGEDNPSNNNGSLGIESASSMASLRVIYTFINMQAIRVLHRRYIKHLVSQLRLIDTPWNYSSGAHRVNDNHHETRRKPFSSRHFSDAHIMSCL
jgi:hypothetical protein